MDERVLLRISLAASVIGIFLLVVMLNFFTVADRGIGELQKEREGSSVRVKGFVESVADHEGFAVIEIAELKTVSAIMFTSENVSLEKGEGLEVTGKIRNYRGRNELVIERVRRT